MAVLFITEYQELARPEPGMGQIAQAPALAEQTVAITGASLQSAQFNASTRFIRLSTDAICSISIDFTPTATATKGRLPADNVEYFGVRPGMKIAVISNI